MPSIESLKRDFAVPGRVEFLQMGELEVVQVHSDTVRAAVTLQGAQLIDYAVDGQALIWLSSDARLAKGKSIRGGIPVCWPWFGAHPEDASLPAHGFARTVPWRLLRADCSRENETVLEFVLPQNVMPPLMMTHKADLRMTMRIGRTLELALQTTSLCEKPIKLTEALHTYFAVGDVAQVVVGGLAGRDYLDKVTGFDRKQQIGAVRIDGEVDRIYLDTNGRSEIRDPVLKRRIRLRAANSASTIVWNPGPERAREMGDLGQDGYRRMLCVESGNAAENVITLEPGEVHTLRLRIEQVTY